MDESERPKEGRDVVRPTQAHPRVGTAPITRAMRHPRRMTSGLLWKPLNGLLLHIRGRYESALPGLRPIFLTSPVRLVTSSS